MKKIETFLRKKYKWVIAVISVFFLVTSILNANNDSATFDEIAHIPAGYSYLTEHDMRLNPEHPPLIKELSAVPLLFLNLNFDTTQDFWTQDVNGQWAAGRHLLYEAGNNPDAIVFWSRIPIILISLILGLFIFKWVKEFAGTLAGLLSFTIYSFDPNILGHNHYVTTDIGIAAFLTFAFYYFIRFLKAPSWKNAFIGGVFLGLLQLAKFSSITAFPILGAALIVFPLIKKIKVKDGEEGGIIKKKFQTLFDYILKGLYAFAISMILVWGVYLFSTFNMPQGNLEKTVNFYFDPSDQKTISVLTRETLLTLNQNSITRPLSEYILGVGMVFKRVAGGNSAYYFGEVSSEAFVSYFPVVFVIKETFGFLILLFIALAISITQTSKKIFYFNNEFFRKTWKFLRDYLRKKPQQYIPYSFVLLYAYLSITGNLNIGFRHLFPILPFLFILIGVKITTLIRRQAPLRRNIYTALLYATVLILVLETLLAFPYYVSFFNQAAGGPKNGHNYVTDSNADWGQDLKRLQKFLDKHPEIEKIRVDYFGGGNQAYYLGDKYLQWWDSKRPIENGWYAVSTNFLQGSMHDESKSESESWKWIQGYQPDYQVGTSILIYHIQDQ
ncbi:ArnT family glycosyltransferase [Patescibacteria group bacterium]